MKIKGVLVVGIMLLSAMSVFAQDYAKVEVPIYYSYARFNPTYSSVVSGFSFNGGGGTLAYYINHFVGIEMELNGYASLRKTFVFPAGASSTACPLGCTITADANMFTYNFGPVFKPYRASHFEPFVEVLFGGAHTNTYGNALAACAGNCVTSAAPSNNAWDFVAGGGIDIPVSKSISIRPAQFDYWLTRFNNIVTTNNRNQSNFRYQGGVVFRF